MTPELSELNIAATALIAQFALIVIITLGLAVLSTNWRDGVELTHGLWRMLAFLFLATMGVLLLSREVLYAIQPMLGGVSGEGLRTQAAIQIAFSLDLFLAGLLIWKTGGSPASPFTPLLGVVPTLGLFLRQPIGWVVIYLTLAAGIFSFCFRFSYEGDWWARTASRTIQVRWVVWLVGLASLILTTAVGLATRR